MLYNPHVNVVCVGVWVGACLCVCVCGKRPPSRMQKKGAHSLQLHIQKDSPSSMNVCVCSLQLSVVKPLDLNV